LQLQHSISIKTVKKGGKPFPEVFAAVAALNKAVLFTTLQHFTWIQVCVRNISYAYSIFRKIRTYALLTYSILSYAYPRVMVGIGLI